MATMRRFSGNRLIASRLEASAAHQKTGTYLFRRDNTRASQKDFNQEERANFLKSRGFAFVSLRVSLMSVIVEKNGFIFPFNNNVSFFLSQKQTLRLCIIYQCRPSNGYVVAV